MLNAMREGAKSGITKYILFSFMIMAVAGLVMMDVGGFFRGGSQSNAVATISGDELPITQFDNIVRRDISKQGLDVKTAYQLGLVQRILYREINDNLMRGEARKVGIRVGDNVVKEQIKNMVAPYVTEEVTAKQALDRYLYSLRMTEVQFVEGLRNEMTNKILRNTLAISTMAVSEQEVSDLYRYQHESRKVKAVHLPHKRITEFQKATDEILLPLYQSARERYAIPEVRSLTTAVLTEEQVKDNYEITEEELRAVYEEYIDTYSLPERRKFEQIIVEAKGKAETIVETINAGKSMKEATKEVMGSEDSYMGEDSFEQKALPIELADPVFTAESGTVLGPIETGLGFHIITVKEIIEPSVQSFSEVKEQIEQDELQDRLADEMYTLANTIDDLLAGGETLENVAQEMGLTPSSYGPVRIDGSTPEKTEGMPGLEDEDRGFILEAGFSLNEGEVSPVMELADGRFVIVRADAITERSYKTFEEVKGEIEKAWIQNQKELENKMAAQDMLKALQEDKTTLKAIAKENKSQVKTYTLERIGEIDEKLSTTAKTDFFDTPEGYFVMTRTVDSYVLGRIESVTLPKTDKLDEEEFSTLRDKLRREAQDDYGQVFMKYLQDKNDVVINDRLLEQTYGGGVDAL